MFVLSSRLYIIFLVIIACSMFYMYTINVEINRLDSIVLELEQKVSDLMDKNTTLASPSPDTIEFVKISNEVEDKDKDEDEDEEDDVIFLGVEIEEISKENENDDDVIDMTDEEIEHLKQAKLKEILKQYDLDTKGTKAVLVSRLIEFRNKSAINS